MSVKLIAIRDISGDYGTVSPGDPFVCDEAIAESLEARGLAERHREHVFPVHNIEDFKMKLPIENKMVEPQRNKRRA